MSPEDVDLNADPILVVGWRPRAKQLAAAAVDLAEDAYEVVRGLAGRTIDQWQACEQLPWHPDAHVEAGEQVLVLPAVEIPGAGNEAEPVDGQLGETAKLLDLVLSPGQLDTLHPEQLAGGRFRFCAAIWEDGLDGGPLAIVAEHDPTSVLRNASHWFRFDGTLRSAPAPDFTLPNKGDLILTHEEIFILNPTTFDRLFSDVRALLNDVPAATAALQSRMASLPLTEAATEALEEVCSTRPSLARRLQRLSQHPVVPGITGDKLRPVVEKHGEDPDEFLTHNALDIGPDKVRAWLDIVEGRWYDADFSDEPRRAARWSTR